MTSVIEAPMAPRPPHVSIPPHQRVVLIGFMGAGKTTIGRLLGLELGWQFIDTDAEVERRFGATIADMFLHEGESVFRRRESAAIAQALGREHAVIALGGGAVESLTNQLLLEQTPNTAVIFLHAPFNDLFNRCVHQKGSAVRPVLQDAQMAAERYRTRLPLYRRCARIHSETAGKYPRETVGEIIACLERLSLAAE